MITHGQAGDLLIPHSPLYQGFFGRMFRNLPAFVPEGAKEEDKVENLRELGGQMHETQEEAPKTPKPQNPSCDEVAESA